METSRNGRRGPTSPVPVYADPLPGQKKKKQAKDASGELLWESLVREGQPHFDEPLRHAEVKAVNELLWARQRQHEEGWRTTNPDSAPPPLGRDALEDMRFDARWTEARNREPGDPADACANCHNMLRDVPSYTGRLQVPPGDYRIDETRIPPALE